MNSSAPDSLLFITNDFAMRAVTSELRLLNLHAEGHHPGDGNGGLLSSSVAGRVSAIHVD
ncbi:hypothetical protein [Paeniglutamicibacter terrestris]|uniref:Uncharacterized protein n=1 Tax=Paeniglutamicibacter terrestris TaxID=2723403 RepID=A0ABX1G645_9MICC|nr:hypothetical protein [Paeniglutamicibacter terrestris]ASN40374.1 hypothetical protein CGQ24_16095 [Arthrobacter sp. 7749]NKG21730.1 hypothetical protein [Paeniglutamicibacter terrestris]